MQAAHILEQPSMMCSLRTGKCVTITVITSLRCGASRCASSPHSSLRHSSSHGGTCASSLAR